ncbi:MAG: type II toxin-antitoxin system RelE family toxin, partial [Minisyncoccales bacterium]
MLYERVLNKIEEIINSYDIESYKNLRNNLKNYKRVHVGSFVLIFRFDKLKKLIIFEDLDHHDKIYKR